MLKGLLGALQDLSAALGRLLGASWGYIVYLLSCFLLYFCYFFDAFYALLRFFISGVFASLLCSNAFLHRFLQQASQTDL